jgi:hypothetical protein
MDAIPRTAAQVVGFDRNHVIGNGGSRWSASIGMGGRDPSEYAMWRLGVEESEDVVLFGHS